MRKLVLFLAVFAATIILTLPMFYDEPQSFGPPIAGAPIYATAGNTFPVAGQEAPDEETGGLVLNAPDIIDVGQLVILDARSSDVDHITWQVIPHTEDFRVVDDGTDFLGMGFLSARPDGPAQYVLILSGSKATPDGKSISFLQHKTIVVNGVDLDEGPTTLVSKVSSWVRRVENYEGKDEAAKRLAGVFSKLATKESVTVDTILQDTAAGNTGALGDDLEKWKPFLLALEDNLDALIQAGGLETREDYRETWLAIARGIHRTVPATKLTVDKETEK